MYSELPGPSKVGKRTCVVTDADGRQLSEYDGVDIDDRTEEGAERFARFSPGLIDQERLILPWTAEAENFGYRMPTSGIVGLKAVAKYGIRFRRSCLFDVPQRIIDVFDPITHQQLGTIGPAGYTGGEELPAERFPAAPLNPMSQGGTHTLSFPSIVYWMELDQHRVRPIFTAQGDDPVVAAIELPPQSDPTVVVVTRSRLHVMLPSGKTVYSASHGLDLSKHWFNFAILPPNQHLVMQANPVGWESESEYPYRLLEFDKDGSIVRSTTAAPLAYETQPTKLRRTAMMGAIYPLGGLPLLSQRLMGEVFELDIQRHGSLFYAFLIASAVMSATITLLVARLRFQRDQDSRLVAGKWIARTCGRGSNAQPQRLAGPRDVRVLRRQTIGRPPQLFTVWSCSAPPSIDGREIFEPADAFPSAA